MVKKLQSLLYGAGILVSAMGFSLFGNSERITEIKKDLAEYEQVLKKNISNSVRRSLEKEVLDLKKELSEYEKPTTKKEDNKKFFTKEVAGTLYVFQSIKDNQRPFIDDKEVKGGLPIYAIPSDKTTKIANGNEVRFIGTPKFFFPRVVGRTKGLEKIFTIGHDKSIGTLKVKIPRKSKKDENEKVLPSEYDLDTFTNSITGTEYFLIKTNNKLKVGDAKPTCILIPSDLNQTKISKEAETMRLEGVAYAPIQGTIKERGNEKIFTQEIAGTLYIFQSIKDGQTAFVNGKEVIGELPFYAIPHGTVGESEATSTRNRTFVFPRIIRDLNQKEKTFTIGGGGSRGTLKIGTNKRFKKDENGKVLASEYDLDTFTDSITGTEYFLIETNQLQVRDAKPTYMLISTDLSQTKILDDGGKIILEGPTYAPIKGTLGNIPESSPGKERMRNF